MKKYTESLGWYGVIAILSAYGLVSFSILQPTSLIYQILNGTGALGIVIDSIPDKNYQPIILNIIWAIIAGIIILRIIL
ncbi:MAG: echA1 protein [Candidatus Parcubacteria bacterium]|jgi:multidrug transporter EmrE-like cation transporter